MKTATVERYHVYGTPRHELRVTYQGYTLNWYDGQTHCYAIVQNDPTFVEGTAKVSKSGLSASGMSVDVQACMQHAKRMGFTHVKFVGDWDKRTKPQGGKLQ